ncbi:hypothetical protein Y032_0324g2530 [Ancylostoma ceylanicum]|uniref:Uncharacterized protein n=1 Tax=Ancylostoma ceylanicum TaxID=53326 RepID=A0A016S126_9BILA|nr:hypothetical protein Y032_0324g2530 [Ancylostoma ceylanicum]
MKTQVQSVILGKGGAAELCEWSICPTSQSQSPSAPPISGITSRTLKTRMQIYHFSWASFTPSQTFM